MKTRSHKKLVAQLHTGHVYRRENLLTLTTAVDRDLMILIKIGLLEKVAPGLYYKPVDSRFGTLPPSDEKLVRSFLRDDPFLLYSWNQYNALGLGLTQLYDRMVVYNRKRHGLFKLGDNEFDFQRPARGFPNKLSREFLLVDVVNNLKALDEDPDFVKAQIKKHINKFNIKKIHEYAKQYGKITTFRFFEEISH